MDCILNADEIPRLDELRNFPAEDGSNDIADEIGSDYDHFGTLLLEDKYGSKLNNIEKMKHGDPVGITVEILRQWLQGKGRQPVTWQTLVKCLQDTKLNVLASKINSTLSQEGGCKVAGTTGSSVHVEQQPAGNPTGQLIQQPSGKPAGQPLCKLSFSYITNEKSGADTSVVTISRLTTQGKT